MTNTLQSIATLLLVCACLALMVVVVRSRREAARLRAKVGRVEHELRRVEGEAARLETVRRDFVANISHELRTPLSSIKLLAETLEAGALDDHSAALTFVHKIGVETDHLISMAMELLDLARLEATPSIHPRAIDPMALAVRTTTRMRELARHNGVALRMEIPPLLPAVWADEEHAGRVLTNLLSNALKFTPRGGAVVVTARRVDESVSFSVCDTGPGIPAGEEKRLFERFYKVDRARGRGGTGLGLSIARHIVEAHGGRITARNRPEGGACFSFTLPLAPSSVTGEA